MLTVTLVCKAQIDDKLITEDSRLKQKVSISSERIYLKDFLSELSDKTSVSIRCNEEDMASAIPLTVNFEEVPLYQVLDSLWSLTSNQDGAYKWSKYEVKGKSEYLLSEPYSIKNRSLRMHEFALRAYDEYLDELYSMSELTTVQRQKRMKGIKRHINQKQTAMLDAILGSEQTWDGLKLFKELVPIDKRRDVLYNGDIIRIKVDQTSSKTKQLFLTFWTNLHSEYTDVGRQGMKVPMPEEIEISSTPKAQVRLLY